jgi:serine/threonine-protein phosphatase 2A regulatory subunit B'
MAEPVVLGLLKYWPEVNSPKQVQFLHELEEVLELTQLQEFKVMVVPLFRRVAACLASMHFQVAERTLLLWNNEYLFTLVTQNRAMVLPIVYDVLKQNAEGHWNATVQSLSQNVLKSFQDTDKALYEDVAKQAQARAQQTQEARVRRQALWGLIESEQA